MHIYKYIQSHIIILQQHVSVSHVAIISLPYNENAISIVNKYMIKTIKLILWSSNYIITSLLKYIKVACVCVV